jgi:hypothetical protein
MKGRFLTLVFLSLIAFAYAQNHEKEDAWVLVGPKNLHEHLQFMKKAWGANFTIAEVQILMIHEKVEDKHTAHSVLEVLLTDQMYGASHSLGLREKKVFRIYAAYSSLEKPWKLQKDEKVIVFLAPAKVPGELNLNATMFMRANKVNLQHVREELEQLKKTTESK